MPVSIAGRDHRGRLLVVLMLPGAQKGGVSSNVLVCKKCIIPNAETQPVRNTHAKVGQMVVNRNLGCPLSLLAEC